MSAMSSASNGPDATADLPESPEALEAAIVARRAHLAGTLDELADRVKPANLAHDAKDEAVTRARAAVTDEQGNVLYERIAAVGAAVLAVVVAAVAIRRRSHR